MDGSTLSWVAIVISAMAGLAIGWLWYSPILLGKRWMLEAGITEEQIQRRDKVKLFGGAFAALLIMSYCLARFIASPTAILQVDEFFNPSQQGAFYGFVIGFGWVFFGIVVLSLFEQRSKDYIAINGGYWVIALTAMGGIIGALQ